MHGLSARIIACCDILTRIAPIKPLLVISRRQGAGHVLDVCPSLTSKLHEKHMFQFAYLLSMLESVELSCAVWVVAQKGALCHLILLHRLWGAGPLVRRILQSLQIGWVRCGPWCAPNLHVHHVHCHHVHCCRDPLLGNSQSWGSRTW